MREHSRDRGRLEDIVKYAQNVNVIISGIEWNTGNHFVDGTRRTAKGFAWCINKIINSPEK